jgi:sugar phosphate isomerase/epimerase
MPDARKSGGPKSTPPDLLASYWTIAGGALPHTDKEYSPFEFKERVEAAAKAGFRGIGIWHADLAHTLERQSLREMKRILDDNGVNFVELEFLTDWFLEGERKKKSDVEKKRLLDAAGALEAHHVKVGDFYREPCTMARLIKSFTELCADAATAGTKIAFELMPFAMIDTLEGSLEMIEGAGAENGGIALDLWHVVKLRIPNERISRIPKKYLISVELNDGTFEAPWSLHEDTVNHRRLCGEGEFDIRGFIEAVQKAGYSGPFGIEVLSEELRKWPLEKLTTRAFETTISHFQ